ncbi:MAG: hypothetical protein JNM06_26090 [Blastocatellia bacterium]|nr:hypothetical protein [Blastocatellia bacterium]
MSDTEKHFFVSGYCAGFDRGYYHMLVGLAPLDFLVNDLFNGLVPKDKLNTVKNTYETTKDYLLVELQRMDYRVTVAKVKEKVNILYLEKSNRIISMDDIIELAIDSIRGTDISERILDRRKYHTNPNAYLKETLEKTKKSK